MGTEGSDWKEDWKELKRIEEADPPVPLAEHEALIRRVATQLGESPEGDLAEVLTRTRATMKEGSKRVITAITAAQAAFAAGDPGEAKSLLKAAIATEPIEYYKEILNTELAKRS